MSILDDLPPPGHNRWVPQHKSAVVRAVTQGLLSIAAVQDRYTLTFDEFVSWWREFRDEAVTT